MSHALVYESWYCTNSKVMMGLNVAAENCNMHVREVDVCGYLATCRDLGEITKFHFGACEIQSKLALDLWAKFCLRLETNLSTADRKVLTSRTSRCRGGACGSGTARGCYLMKIKILLKKNFKLR